jgi:hypothetical protein
MTRRTLNRIARRLAIGLVLAAVVVPATAQAMPIGKVSGPHRNSSVYVPADPGQFRLANTGAWVPVDAGQIRLADETPAGSQQLRTVVLRSPASSGFDWTDALIGSGVTAAGLAVLAMAAALAARRQGRLGYR